jgi:hypothetical protein
VRPKVRHLTERMDTGVGAARAVNDDLLLRDLRGDFVQRALDRRHARLDLPAVEVRAVIGDGEFQGAHAIEKLSHGAAKCELCRLETEEVAPAWDRGPPKAAFHLARPRRSRTMGSSILASLSEAGGNDPNHWRKGPFLPVRFMMRIVRNATHGRR